MPPRSRSPSLVSDRNQQWGSGSWARDTLFLKQRKQFFLLLLNRLSGPQQHISGQTQFSILVATGFIRSGDGVLFKTPGPRLPPKAMKTESLGLKPRRQHLYKLPVIQ